MKSYIYISWQSYVNFRIFNLHREVTLLKTLFHLESTGQLFYSNIEVLRSESMRSNRTVYEQVAIKQIQINVLTI